MSEALLSTNNLWIAKSYTYLHKFILGRRKVLSKESKKNIIENLGLTNQNTCKNAQVIYLLVTLRG